MVASHVGKLPFARFTPEGLEDLDCTDASGARAYIQMKEVGGGAGRFTAADVADALVHSARIPGDVTRVILTDGALGSGLASTGWTGVLADQRGEFLDTVIAHLVNRGLSRTRAVALLRGSRLIQLPWNVREESEALLADTGVHAAVASFVVSALYDTLSESSANQRNTSMATAITHASHDVATAIARVQSVVDLDGLEAAVAAGVCAPADFLHPSAVNAAQFYEGVGGAPAHIASGLDVLRAAEMAQIVDAAEHERYVVVVGPSGAGKSVLLWRAARDAILGARVLRVQRIATDSDVDLLVRHVRLMAASQTSQVVVAADDLGRPQMASWGRAVDELREVPWVFLLGASREEDFTPVLLRGNARVVKPQLDKQTAMLIADQVRAAGVDVAMSADEAWARSDGLLMEFLALLTRAKHLEQVLAEQAHALKQDGRQLQRTAARLITAAHSFGLAIAADALGQMDRPEAVGDALAVLQGEHVITVEGSSWRGLHELRSRVLSTLLHQSPPPSIADTWSAVARLVSPAEAGWLLRRVAEQDPDSAPAVAASVAAALSDGSRGALDMAKILEGADRADNAIYARTVLPILQREARGGVSLQQLELFVYGIRHQGLRLQGLADAGMNQAMHRIEQIAAMLPDRPHATLAAAAAQVSRATLVALVLDSTIEHAVRLLDATSGLVVLEAQDARVIVDHFWDTGDPEALDLLPRLIEVLARGLDPNEWSDAVRTIDERVAVATHSDPSITSVTLSRTDQAELLITITTVLPPHMPPRRTFEWDPAPREKPSHANDHAVAIANRIAVACPEADLVEVITITPSGARHVIEGVEHGYKRMPRSSFPDRVAIRRSVGFQAAMRRLTAASTWTDFVRDQSALSAELAQLLEEAPARLRAADSASHRHRWQERVERLSKRAANLASQPVKLAADPAMTHAQADEAERRVDRVSDAIHLATNRLGAILEGNLFGTGSLLRKSRDMLIEARESSDIALGESGKLVRPVPQDVIDRLSELARLLIIVNAQPAVAAEIDVRDLGASVARVVSDAIAKEGARQRDILSACVGDVPEVSLHQVVDPEPYVTSVSEQAWFIIAPLEHWNELVEALRALASNDRQALGCNVIAAAVRDGVVLPVGITITHTPGRKEFPAQAETLQVFAKAAGLPMVSSSQDRSGLVAFLDGLSMLSWDSATQRIRPPDWPAVAMYADLEVNELVAAAREAVSLIPPEAQSEVKGAVDLLAELVGNELATGRALPAGTITLSGEMFDHALDEEHHGPAQPLWDAIAVLSAVVALGDALPS
jgi:hypothetical protein